MMTLDKLTIDGEIIPDPYGVASSEWKNEVNNWPDITYPDIYQYFVETSSFYTRTEARNIKALDGYQYFSCGHVQPVLLHDPKIQDVLYLKADVMPSQRQSSKKDMYKTYLIVHKNGEIVTAHCTCMAG